MKALHLALLASLVAAAALALPAAAAQQNGSLTIHLETPERPVAPGQTLVVRGSATLVADALAYAHLEGIPVTFTIEGPAWASLVVTPSSAVFPASAAPGFGYVSTIPFHVAIAASEGPEAQEGAYAVKVRGVTTPGMLSRPIAGQAETLVRLDLPEKEEACEDEATAKQVAADALDAPQHDAASPPEQDAEEVRVQSAAARPVAGAWGIVAACAVAGALGAAYLQRRLGK
jgi:hypothetical protein